LEEFKEQDDQDELFENKFSFSDKKAMDDFDNVIVPRSKKIQVKGGKTKWSMSTTDGKSSDQSANPHLFNFQHQSDSSNKSHVDPADLKLMHHKFDDTLQKCHGEMQIVMRISENSLMLDKFLRMFRGLAEKIKISLD